MKDKELQNLIEKETKELVEKQFNLGVIAGWNACLVNIKKEIANIRSSKGIKKIIDNKIKESKERIENSVDNKEGN